VLGLIMLHGESILLCPPTLYRRLVQSLKPFRFPSRFGHASAIGIKQRSKELSIQKDRGRQGKGLRTTEITPAAGVDANGQLGEDKDQVSRSSNCHHHPKSLSVIVSVIIQGLCGVFSRVSKTSRHAAGGRRRVPSPISCLLYGMERWGSPGCGTKIKRVRSKAGLGQFVCKAQALNS